MDEILIDEKKYVSSKQAAKMTGYAKDYVGQLCREGRVPARLVGRSWYVLESAIQDHRFSAKDAPKEKSTGTVTPSKTIFSQKWESPRYVASSEELLPQIQRPVTTAIPKESESEKDYDPSKYLQDSWKEWFDHINTEKAQELVITRNNSEENKAEIEASSDIEVAEEGEVKVPVHAMQNILPHGDLAPHHLSLEKQKSNEETEIPIAQWEPPVNAKQTGKRVAYGIIRLLAVVVSLGFISLAVANSGYVDKYIASYRQLDQITGIQIYNK